MKKNLKVALRQFGGAEITITETVGGKEVRKPALISEQVGQALWQHATAGDTPEEKYRAFQIAQRIAENPEAVELSNEDIVLIKKIIAPVFAVGYYGQIVDLLEK
ncbi:hypothetical protein SAMN05216354_0601 [Xylanibacter ruminicola]|uniref:Uncharacterized protein n=1 Tax=Xylanibacter ruminicola TaxID=839 RepID=A0A1H5SB20_XYLRU|nr:hypothetical protein SAMN05216354_0601 [Xylanibacter ruminicola]